jgi:hypothetical protein
VQHDYGVKRNACQQVPPGKPLELAQALPPSFIIAAEDENLDLYPTLLAWPDELSTRVSPDHGLVRKRDHGPSSLRQDTA